MQVSWRPAWHFCYIGWEMPPTSIGGEQQAGISGGSQSPS